MTWVFPVPAVAVVLLCAPVKTGTAHVLQNGISLG